MTSTPPPTDQPNGQGTDTIPVVRTDADAAATAPRSSFAGRLAASVADPVLRILVTATLIGRFGRGVFFTMTVLYFTFVVGLSVGEIALILGIASGVGVGTSYLGGRLADRFSARRLLVALMTAEGIALLCYPLAGSFTAALVAACTVSGFGSAANSVRMAIIARAFTAAARVNARAVLRTVTNLAIALGASAAGVALLIGTPEAYRTIMIVAGLVHLAGVIPLLRLPARVDAPRLPAILPGETAKDSTPGSPATGIIVAESGAAALAAAPAAGTDPAPRARSHPTDPGAVSGGRSPFRDPRYLALTALSGIFGMQFGLAEVGVPLWVAHDTQAPEATISLLLILNTVVVIIFQVPLSRGTHDIRLAGRVTVFAGFLMVVACLLYAAAAGFPVWVAVAVLVLGALVHAFAEVWSQAGAWGLSFELADESRAGAYQGVFSMGFGLGAMTAPLVIAATALEYGLPGWIVLAVLFLLSALGIGAIARRAAGH